MFLYRGDGVRDLAHIADIEVESEGFFSVFGVVGEDGPADDFEPTIVSLLPTADVNKLFGPEYSGTQALVIMKNIEEVDGQKLANFEVITTNQDGGVVLKGYAQARVD